jgi:hypothetical protein
MLVVATVDVQLLPGHPCLTSSLILTCFHLTALHEYVRARTDQNLQQLISLARQVQPLTPNEQNEFIFLILNFCTHVDHWNDEQITTDMVRILGTRK